MNKKAFVEERQTRILEYVKTCNRANVLELAEKLDVTEATIRRDLRLLEDQGLINRTHGGAIKRDNPALWQTTSMEERMVARRAEKDRIAEFVSHIINDNSSVMIDGGSTTQIVAERLSGKQNLLVVTNCPSIGLIFLKGTGSKVLLTGGELMRGTYSVVGVETELELRRIRTDKAIIGVSALSAEEGLFSANPHEGEVKRLMIMNSRETIVVADSSKFDIQALYMFSDFERISKLVTDKDIGKDALLALQKKGVEIFTV
ncbi:MAG: DeoR/GlpR family DNA-binding transcription regulator [Treponema sp.]|nr:DeoR/GlpR family DNA-binding transcription regulator [Treponema sp.]